MENLEILKVLYSNGFDEDSSIFLEMCDVLYMKEGELDKILKELMEV